MTRSSACRAVHGTRLATVALAAALAASASAAPVATVVGPVMLPKLPAGWTAWSARPNLLRPHGTYVQTSITSWGYRFTAPGPGAGAAIPPGGVYISVELLRSQAPHSPGVNLCSTAPVEPGHPRRMPPLTLPKTTTDTFEGTPHVKEYRVFGRYHNLYNFEVRADIDTRRPIRTRWAAAERIVSRLRFPKWPTRPRC